MSLSVSTAWDETAAFAKREARFLFPIAFFLMSLPTAILQLVAPVTAPGRLPESGAWLLLVPAVPAAGLIGALAISRLALSPADRGGAAFAAAFRGFLPLLGAVLLIGFAAAVLAMAALLLAVVIAAPLLSVLALLALLALAAFFWVRLMMLTPAAAVEPIGPAQLIMRSWALTAGNFWRLFGFLLVVAIVSLVALIAAGAVGGIAIRLTAGQPRPGTLAMALAFLVSALLQAVISGLFTTFLARLYAQLAGDASAGFKSDL
jgi:hypothetical protein